jgi:hypothetical protein
MVQKVAPIASYLIKHPFNHQLAGEMLELEHLPASGSTAPLPLRQS